MVVEAREGRGKAVKVRRSPFIVNLVMKKKG